MKIVNKDIIKALIYSGAFDKISFNRRTLIENIDVILNYADLVSDLADDTIEIPNIIEYEEYKESELAKIEYEYLNLYLNIHPVTLYRKKYNYPISTKGVSNYMSKNIHISYNNEIKNFSEKYKKITTKTGNDMAFMTISDEYGKMECTIFPNEYLNIEQIEIGDIVIVYGKTNSRNGNDQVIVNNIKVIES